MSYDNEQMTRYAVEHAAELRGKVFAGGSSAIFSSILGLQAGVGIQETSLNMSSFVCR